MPEVKETVVPETPVFQAELEEQLRREARTPKRFSVLAFLTADLVRFQRLVLHGGMSVMVFIIAAAMALPMLRVEPGPAIAARAVYAEVPITAEIPREPSHEPSEQLLIDGRFEVEDLETTARYASDDERSYIR